MSERYIVIEEQLWNALIEAYGLGMERGYLLARLKPGEASEWSCPEELHAKGNECRTIEIPEEITHFGSHDKFEGSEKDCCFYWKEIPK